MGNFLTSIAYLVNAAFDIVVFLILVRAIISWFSPDPFNPLVQFLHRVTEPILEPVRRLLPSMPIDISPLVVWAAIHFFLQPFLVKTLYDMAMRFG